MKYLKHDIRIIEEYYKFNALELIDLDLLKLSVIYQGKNANMKECLLSDVTTLFSDVTDLISLNEKISKSMLNEYINVYNKAITCFLNFNHAFVIIYSRQTNQTIKEKAFTYIGSSQAHLTKLQSQYNQLVYKKQQSENKRSMIIARISLFLGIISIIISIWDDLKKIVVCILDNLSSNL
jgi:hypothetical protein